MSLRLETLWSCSFSFCVQSCSLLYGTEQGTGSKMLNKPNIYTIKSTFYRVNFLPCHLQVTFYEIGSWSTGWLLWIVHATHSILLVISGMSWYLPHFGSSTPLTLSGPVQLSRLKTWVNFLPAQWFRKQKNQQSGLERKSRKGNSHGEDSQILQVEWRYSKTDWTWAWASRSGCLCLSIIWISWTWRALWASGILWFCEPRYCCETSSIVVTWIPHDIFFNRVGNRPQNTGSCHHLHDKHVRYPQSATVAFYTPLTLLCKQTYLHRALNILVLHLQWVAFTLGCCSRSPRWEHWKVWETAVSWFTFCSRLAVN